MSIVRIEQECSIRCDYCRVTIPPHTEYFVTVIGTGSNAEEEYRCEDCEEIRRKLLYGKLYPYV